MKKTISILLVCVFLFALAVPTFAAGTINTYEKKLIDYVKTKYKTDKGVITVDKKYINAAENLAINIDLDKAQYDKIVAILDKAYAYVIENKLDDWDELKGDIAKQDVLLGYADEALAVIGYTLTADRANNLLIIKDADGNIVASLTPRIIIVQTGADNTAVAVVSAIAVLTVAAALGVKSFRKEDDAA